MIKFKFIVPILFAIILMVADHKFNVFSKLKMVVKSVVVPIYVLLDIPVNIYQILNNGNNNSGINLNKELLSLKAKAQQYNKLLLENKRLGAMLDFSYSIKKSKFILARVTNINQSRLTKQIVINRGIDDNIKVGNIVLSDNGVVGRVVSTYFGYSTVRLITDPLQYTPVINIRSGIKGVARGVANNDNKLIIKYLNPKSDVRLGDSFSTSGIADVFRGSYNIGVVSNILQNNQESINLEITPSQDINSIIFVLVEGI